MNKNNIVFCMNCAYWNNSTASCFNENVACQVYFYHAFSLSGYLFIGFLKRKRSVAI